MGDMLIRNFPEDLKRMLSEAARKNGRSLSDEAKEALRTGIAAAKRDQHLAQRNAYDDFRQTFSDALLSDEEHADMMRAIHDWKQQSMPPKAQAAE
jgi:antitoxin FitA